MLLWLVVYGFSSALASPHLPAGRSFAETAAVYSRFEWGYRAAVLGDLILTLSSVVLAFALYELLRGSDRSRSLLAFIFCLQDSFIATIVRACSLMRLDLFASYRYGDTKTVDSAELLGTFADRLENIGGICFGFGLGLFFWLFIRSRYLPKPVSAFGLLAATLFTGAYSIRFVFPALGGVVRMISFPAIGFAILASGVCLIAFGMRSPRNRTS